MASVGLSLDSSESSSYTDSCYDSDDGRGVYAAWKASNRSTCGTTVTVMSSADMNMSWEDEESNGGDDNRGSINDMSVLESTSAGFTRTSTSLPLLPSQEQNSTKQLYETVDVGVLGKPSYRSRARRRLEELNRSFPNDDNEIAEVSSSWRNTATRGWRVCFALFAVALVCISQNDGRRRMSDVRHEVALHLHQKEGIPHPSQKLHLQKFYMPKVDTTATPPNPPATRKQDESINTSIKSSSSNNNNNNNPESLRKHRPTLALARSHHDSLPMFGAQPRPDTPKVEQFYLQDDSRDVTTKAPRSGISWATWFACISLAIMFVESLWKEYRRCQIDVRLEERQRQL